MAVFTNQSKNSVTFTNANKSDDAIFLVSEAGDYYLIGSASDEILVTRDGAVFTNQSKNSVSFTNQAKN